MDTGSFIVHVKLEDFYADLPGIVKKTIDTSNIKVKTTLNQEKNKQKDQAD